MLQQRDNNPKPVDSNKKATNVGFLLIPQPSWPWLTKIVVSS